MEYLIEKLLSTAQDVDESHKQKVKQKKPDIKTKQKQNCDFMHGV